MQQSKCLYEVSIDVKKHGREHLVELSKSFCSKEHSQDIQDHIQSFLSTVEASVGVVELFHATKSFSETEALKKEYIRLFEKVSHTIGIESLAEIVVDATNLTKSDVSQHALMMSEAWNEYIESSKSDKKPVKEDSLKQTLLKSYKFNKPSPNVTSQDNQRSEADIKLIAQLKSQLNRTKSELSDTQGQINTIKDQFEASSNKLGILVSEIEIEKERNVKLQSELTEAVSKKKKVERDLQDYKLSTEGAVNTAKYELEEATRKNTILNKDLEIANDKLEKVKIELETESQKAKGLERNISDIEANADARVNHATQMLEDSQKKSDLLSNELGEVTRKLESLKIDYELEKKKYKEEIDALTDGKNNLEKESNHWQQIAEENKEKISNLNSELLTMEESWKLTQQEYLKFKNEVKESQGQLDDTKTKAEMEANQAKIFSEQYEKKMKMIEKELEEEKASRVDIQRDYVNFKDEQKNLYDELMDEKNRLESSENHVQHVLKESLEKQESLKNELAIIEKSKVDLYQTVEKVKSEAKTKEEGLIDARNKAEAEVNHLKQVNEDLDKKRHNLEVDLEISVKRAQEIHVHHESFKQEIKSQIDMICDERDKAEVSANHSRMEMEKALSQHKIMSNELETSKAKQIDMQGQLTQAVTKLKDTQNEYMDAQANFEAQLNHVKEKIQEQIKKNKLMNTELNEAKEKRLEAHKGLKLAEEKAKQAMDKYADLRNKSEGELNHLKLKLKEIASQLDNKDKELQESVKSRVSMQKKIKLMGDKLKAIEGLEEEMKTKMEAGINHEKQVNLKIKKEMAVLMKEKEEAVKAQVDLNAKLKKSLDMIKEFKSDESDKRSKLDVEVNHVKQEKDKLLKDMELLKNELAVVEKSRVDLNSQLQKVSTELKSLKDAKTDLDNQGDAAVNHLKQQLSDATSKITILTKEADELKTNLSNERAAFEKEKTKLKGLIAELKGKIDNQ